MARSPIARRRRLTPLLVLPVLLLAASARAEPEDENTVQLEYVLAPATAALCPGEPMVRHAIITEMKEDPFSPTAKAKVRVIIERKGGLFHARYEIIDSTGKVVLPMKFSPYDLCAIAVEHVGFSLSVHLPRLITGRTPGPRKPPPLPASPLPSSSTTFALPFLLQFDASVLWSLGTAPKPAPGFAFHVGARRPSYSISLGVRVEALVSDGTDTNQVGASRLLGEAVPCVHYHGFVGCGLLQIGSLNARTQDQDIVRRYREPNAAIGFRFGGEWFLGRSFPLNHAALHVSADLVAPIVSRDIRSRKESVWEGSFPTAAVLGGVRVLLGAVHSR